MITAIVVFAICYLLIILEKFSHPVITMIGAILLVFLGVFNQAQALHYVDFNTIGLLIGMMIIVAVLKKSGVLEYIAIKSIKLTAGDPKKILIVLSLITAVTSALLDNVTTVLIIVPITFAIADAMSINPIPILVAEIIFSNIGGTATLIGDPPNIMIGSATELSFMDFIYNNLPIIVVVSLFNILALLKIFKKDLQPIAHAQEIINGFDENRTITDYVYLRKALIVFVITLVAFMTHNIHKLDLATIALGFAFIILFVTGKNPDEVLREVEWPTIFFFMGLFILVGALEYTHVILYISKEIVSLTKGVLTTTTFFVLWFSALASSIIDNVPYTATMISVIKSIAKFSVFDVKPLWWALSLGACLGGNGSPIGAAANIIVIGFSKKSKTPIAFGSFLKVAFPLMIGSIILVNIYIYFRYLMHL